MLHNQRTGSGKILLFIHGSSQSSEVWDELIREPSLNSYTLLRIDLPGHGYSFRSSEPPKDYTFKGIARHIKEFTTTIEGEYIIVAHSLSTNIIAEIITELRGCKGLFLIGASVIGGTISVTDIVRPGPHFGITFSPAPGENEIEALITTWFNQSKKVLPLYTRLFHETDPALRLQLGITISQGDWGNEVGNLEQLAYPVAVVYGENEQLVFTGYLNRSAINLWKGRIILIEDAGHNCQADQPAALASLINEYATGIFI